MQLNTIEHTEGSAALVCDIDRAELERRLRVGLLRHKFIVMIDDHEADDIARDLADEVLKGS